MLKKLKLNFNGKNPVSYLCLFIIVVATFFIPKVSRADSNVYTADQIKILTELAIEGKPDNLIRILKDGSKPVMLTVTMTVSIEGASGNTILVGGGDSADKIDTGAGIAGKRPLEGMGEIILPRDRNSICSQSSLQNKNPLTGVGFLECNLFYAGSSNLRRVSGEMQTTASDGTKVVQLNQSKSFTFQIDTALLKNLLKIDAQSSTSGQAYPFTVAPWVQFRVTNIRDPFTWVKGDIANYVSTDAGKDIYVQFFDSQAALDQAVQNKNRPAGVPEYASNIKSLSFVDTGSTILGLVNKIIGFVIGLLQEFIYLVFYVAIAPIIQAMLSIHTYTDTFAAVIYPGWEVVRNLCNIVFIVALIVIAMATLFRIESYKFRELLVQLIIAALLVNFSLVIAQVVLGVADTVQNQFLPNNVEVIRALAKDLMVAYRQVVYEMPLAQQGEFSYTIQPLFHLALSLGSFMVFLAIAAFLFIRIVMLWILLMISPIAYAAGILPATKNYRSEWWKNFLKYAFFTPIMAFFLNMTAVISNKFHNTTLFGDISGVSEKDLGGSGIAVFVFKVASNILLLVFLIVALKVAEQFGIYGASAISGFAKKGMMAPFAFGGKRAGGYIGKRWNEITSGLVTQEHGVKGFAKKALFAAVNPVSFFRGWGERAKERKEQAKELAKGAGLMVASEALTLGREKVDYKQLATQKIMRSWVSKLRESLGDDPGRYESMDLWRRVADIKGFEGEMARNAANFLSVTQGWGDDTNEVPSSPEQIKKMRAELKRRGTKAGGMALFEEACKTYDDQGFETMQWVWQGLDLNMLARLRKDDGRMYRQDEHGKFTDEGMQAFVSDERNQRALMGMAALTIGARQVGHYEQMFMSKKDEKSGRYIPLVDSEYAKAEFKRTGEVGQAKRTGEIIAEVNKIGIRPFWQNTAWHTLLRKVKKVNPKTGEEYWDTGKMSDGLSLLQETLWTKTLAGRKYASQAGHAQARIVAYLVGKCFDDKGRFESPELRVEYEDMRAKSPDLVKILTYLHLTGNPPNPTKEETLTPAASQADLDELLFKHGNPKRTVPSAGAPPPPPPPPSPP